MKEKTQRKLTELFNQFAKEEQSSAFAVGNLLDRVFKILHESELEDNE